MRIFYFLLLLLLLFVGFIPGFGSIDKYGSQWLFLPFLNIFILLFTFFRSRYKFSNILGSNILLSFIFFLLISIISLFHSLNISESLIEISRLFILFSTITSFYILLNLLNLEFKSISLIFMIYLLAEITFFYFKFFSNSSLLGSAANINILAFSILFKLPFVLHEYFNKSSKFIFLPIFLASSIALFLISSRGALLGLFLLIIFFAIFYFKKFKSFLILSLSLVVSFLFSVKYLLPTYLPTNTKLSNLVLNDQSTNQRLIFYENAISSILNTFPFGVGIGNWKIFSTLYYKDFINNYVVPYHVHNDFLEVGAEIGIFGLISYLLFFILIAKYLLHQIFFKKNLLWLPFLGSVLIFILDSNLNFPLTRPLIMSQLFFIIAFIIYTKKPILKFNFPFQLLLIPILILCSISSYKVYKSFVAQKFIYSDFSSQAFDTPLKTFSNIDLDYPNLAATTLPIKSMLANYYSSDSIINVYLDKSIKENPFIKYPQVLKSIRFTTNQKLDSALYYAKDAYSGISNNELHQVNYLSVLTSLKDSLSIKSLFSKHKNSYSKNFYNAYFLSLLKLNVSGNDSILASLKVVKNKYPEFNKTWDLYELRFTKGQEVITKANQIFLSAEKDFSSGQFNSSYDKFIEASFLIPEDPAYLENAAHSLYMLNQNNRALKLFDSIIDHYPTNTGKAHYLKGLMILETERNKQEACRLFTIAQKKGNSDAKKAIKLFCK